MAAISFLLGLGCGCGRPLSMSLIYALSPRERVSVNNFTHLVIPLPIFPLPSVRKSIK